MRAVCGGDFRTSGRPCFRVSFFRNVVRACPQRATSSLGHAPERQVAVVVGQAVSGKYQPR